MLNNNRVLLRIVTGLCVIFIFHAPVQASQPEQPVRFNRDIRPIFAGICWHCHGPGMQKAGLRLDVRAQATQQTESGIVPIVPGDPTKSEIIRKVFAADETDRMPPPESGKDLTEVQKDLLRRWVLQGAEYETHWSLAPLVRPEVPAIEHPAAPLRNPIDHFVQARLAREGAAPAAEADRRTLIRRLALDLTGLPPTPQQLDAFLNDPSPDAYDNVVKQLLASVGFAEKQAMYWLDAVRYADTVGFHGDQTISVWPYRDYVLRSIRENMPFDQFTREQLAGDLLPQPARTQLVATAFNRLNRMTTEGGAQDKEYRAKYAADRVRTVAMIWLGATLGCAECHDHKFDPFTQRDFYSMAAFFGDVDEYGFYPGGFSQGDWGPRISLPSPQQEKQLAELDSELEQVRAELSAVSDDQLAPARELWEQRLSELDTAKELGWRWFEPTSATSTNGAQLTIHPDGLVTAGGPNPDRAVYTVTAEPGAGRWTALLLETGVDEQLPGNRIGRGWVSYVLTELELEVAEPDGSVQRIELSEAVSDGVGQSHRYPNWGAIDGDPETGLAFELGHSAGHKLLVRFRMPVQTTGGVWTVRLRQESNVRRATIGRFKLAVAQVPGATLDDNALPKQVLDALRAELESRSSEQTAKLAEHFRVAAEQLEPLRRREAALRGSRELLLGQVPTVLVTERTLEPRVVRVLPRGNWMDDSGPIVAPAIPAVFGQLDCEKATRLDLANWLVSRDNPMVARAFANRIWKQFFGAGLAGVLDDLGSQGQLPSHPELLDWLAAEFIEPSWQAEGCHPWDWRHLVQVIVTSHTYRQASTPRPERDQADPDNRLLARQNPVRLDAEIIRDNALAISGLLRERFGGPSVFPVQPDGYWSPLNFPKREYAASYGDDLHRRSLYTHWQRTFVHPTLLAFDACTREEASVNRARSNTPLQALVLLNDPIYQEAACVFGRLILEHAGASLDQQLDFAFLRALSRLPTTEERAVLSELYANRLAEFRADTQAARTFVTVGDSPPDDEVPVEQLAAMSVVARTILNLHETITRD